MSEIASTPFNMNAVRKTIEKNKNESKTSGPSIGFLPEGDHKIRWLFDPEGEIYREVVCHRGGKRWILCPDWLAEKDSENEYPVCGFCKLAEERDDWKIKRRFNYLAYGHVVETKNVSEYWDADTTYVIIGNTRLKRSLVEMLETLADDSEEYLLTMLTPIMSGPFTNVQVTKGSQGSVNITPTVSAKKCPPMKFEEDEYQPLSKCWVSTKFEINAYTAALKETKDQLAEQEKESASDNMDAENNPAPEGKPVSPLAAVTSALGEDEPTDVVTNVTVTDEAPTPAEETSAPATTEEIVAPPADQLPEDCLGWTKYDPSQPACIVCDFSMDCMKAGR